MNRSVSSISSNHRTTSPRMSDMLARINQLEAEMKSEIAQCRRQLTTTVPAKVVRSSSAKLTRARSLDGVIGAVEVNVSGFAAIPEELLWKICRDLNAFQLCQARLICRRWNRIIGTSSLMDKLKVRLPGGCILKSNCEELGVLGGSRYTRVVLDRCMILKPAGWWPLVSGGLHSLNLIYCNVSTEELFEMLKLTPNLRNLTIGVHFGSNVPEVNFQLVALKKLNIQSIIEPESYEIFKTVCPGLRTLALPHVDKDSSLKVLEFIRSVGKTLENLSVQGGDDKFWTNLPEEFEKVRLKRFTCGIKDSRMLEKLLQTQPSIEELILTGVHDADLELGKTLPNLKRLEILVRDTLDGKPLLENLQQLEHLKLESIEFSKPELNVNWSKDFPNLNSLKLKSFDVKDWKKFFEDCPRIKILNSLQLISVDATTKITDFNLPKQNLKTLKISNCKFQTHFIKQLLNLYPDLEEVSLERTADITDAIVQKLCQNAKRLRSFSVTTCKITESSVEHLIDHCGALEKVRIWNCGTIPHNSWQRLRKHRNVQVQYKV
ncbi:conserved hypothetical protein [Culex quinquefasciatus]|uniref:F-box domain-containing protein n=1 Tax=Culex quinquefasciatus TaxID=7176 RepID=B0X500_CULQU|nr:conserved hypothetical protein [Culex quinquefasciatus]|eukprot:XP_001864722.1 conserved hypothetical protein [Culex quinquefasciatus]